MTYAEKLRDPRWQKKRLKILERDKWLCQLCGDDKTTLHIHHKKYTESLPFNEPNHNLITLCADCHSFIEKSKKQFPIKIMKRKKDNRILIIARYIGTTELNEYSNNQLTDHISIGDSMLSAINDFINE